MKKTIRSCLAVLLIAVFLFTLTACTAASRKGADGWKIQGRKDEVIQAHLRKFPAVCSSQQMDALAKKGCYVNQSGTSIGESYQYWMMFYNNVTNNTRASLDVVCIDASGKTSVTYLDYNGKDILAVSRNGKESYWDGVDDQNLRSNNQTLVKSCLIRDGRRKLLFQQDLQSLPKYKYLGASVYINTICEYLYENPYFDTSNSEVMIPVPMVLKVDDHDPENVIVWGDFWVLNYSLRGTILFNESGGEFPLKMVLERVGDKYVVKSMHQAQDGSNYLRSIKRLCDGDRTLYRQFRAIVGDLSNKETVETRKSYLESYLQENSTLHVTAYEDYGWDPVSL